jgi:hypothetical protein
MIGVVLVILTFSFLTYGCLLLAWLLAYRARPHCGTYFPTGPTHVHFPTFLARPILSSAANQSRWAPSELFP